MKRAMDFDAQCRGDSMCNCKECSRLVYVFTPNHTHPCERFVVAESAMELEQKAKEWAAVDADQCGECGGPHDEDGKPAPWRVEVELLECDRKRFLVSCTCGNAERVETCESKLAVWYWRC